VNAKSRFGEVFIPINATITLRLQILLRRATRICCFPATGKLEKGFSNKKGGNRRPPRPA
jgi:hypothetical protein